MGVAMIRSSSISRVGGRGAPAKDPAPGRNLVTLGLLFLAVWLPVSHAEGATMTATWTGGGSGDSWSDSDNWSTPSVPLNDGADTYQVVIPTGHTVDTSSVPTGSEIDSLTLAYGSSLDVMSGSELTVLGAADIAGALTASGGAFTAGNENTTLSGGLASVVASAGGTIAFKDWYLWTGMQSITAGANEGDELAITATNATIDLSSLQSIRSAGRGITRITVNSGGTISFCDITELEQVILDVSGGSSLGVFCEWPLAYSSDQMYSSQGSNTTDIIRASGSNSSLDLWFLVSLDAGFDDGNASHVNIQRIIATQGHALSLWSLQQVTTPVRAEDSLEFVIEDGGSIELYALETISSAGNGSLGFSTIGGSGELRLGALASTVPTQITVTGTVSVDGDVILDGTSLFSVYPSDPLTGTVTSTMEVGGDIILTGASHFSVGSSGPLTATVTSTMSVGGDVSFDFSDASQLDLANVVVNFDAGPDPQYLEVGGLDVGTDTGSLSDDNFGLGQLVVGTGSAPATNLELKDQIDNGNRAGGNEALYLFGYRDLDGLAIELGSSLTLNGLHLYAYEQQAGELVYINALFGPGESEISYDQGTIYMPEPSALPAAALLTLALLARLRSRRARSAAARDAT